MNYNSKRNLAVLLASVVFVSFSAPVYAEANHNAHSGNHASGHRMVKDSKVVKTSKKNAKKKPVKEYRKAMEKMHKSMAIEYSGNPDIDFVKGMIPHHQAAIDMAKIVLKYGKDETIRDLAQRIILAQEQEIGFMGSWLRGRDSGYQYPDAKTADSTVAFEKAMSKMHGDMMISYTGDADIDFANGMIPHHQGAIDMAWILKEHGSNLELRPMLDDIISSQSQEIELMKKWLESNKNK